MKAILTKGSSLLVLSALGAIAPNAAKGEGKQPNILYIFPDQYRVQAMGFMGEDPVLTPNIDKLAAQSVVCYNAVSTMPLSSPYRGMLMTGKYPQESFVRTNCNTYANQFGTYLREDATCFGDVLKAGGYECGYIGKWHLDAPEGEIAKGWQTAVWDSYTPEGAARHGFDYWCAYGCHNEHNNPYYWINDAPVSDTTYAKRWGPEFEADKAIEFLNGVGTAADRDQSKPWALFISMNPPHGPYNQVPQKYKDIYKDRDISELLNRPNVPEDSKGNSGRNNVKDYFACITGVDYEVGRILEALEASGQSENTIVVFTADHGEMMGGHGYMQKVVVYDESFRIPFIVRWPAKLAPRQESLHIGVPDVMPTMLSLSGLSSITPDDLQGEDFSQIILGKSNDRPEFAIYMRPGENFASSHTRGLRSDRYTFTLTKTKEGRIKGAMLFDNQADPYQLKNIADQNPKLVAEFTEKLNKRLTELNDPWIEAKDWVQ